MSYIIGSFNIRDFNLSSKNGERSFKNIAKIIIQEKMDIIAIQEVNAPIAIELVVKELNMNSSLFSRWESKVSGRASGHGTDPEQYAFIWNAKRVSLLEREGKLNPQLIENYRINRKVNQQELIRYPYYARFTVKNHIGGSFFEIRVLNTHIIGPGHSKRERINEFEILVKNIMPKIEDTRYGDSMPAYTFLAGDYNLCLNESELVEFKINPLTESTYNRQKSYYKTVQEKKTSLKALKEEDVDGQIDQGDYYANNYDHFTYNEKLEEKMQLICDRVEPIERLYLQSTSNDKVECVKRYWREISDHVPIKMEVHI